MERNWENSQVYLCLGASKVSDFRLKTYLYEVLRILVAFHILVFKIHIINDSNIYISILIYQITTFSSFSRSHKFLTTASCHLSCYISLGLTAYGGRGRYDFEKIGKSSNNCMLIRFYVPLTP